jgi:hypothetical protein
MEPDMGDEENIVETVAEEAAEAAKAVVADVKAIAAELADAVAEGIARTPLSIAVPADATTSGSNKKD